MPKSTKPQPTRDEGKARFELRFDEDVYSEIKALAEGVGVSVNQFMHALSRWAVRRAHLGEPMENDEGDVVSVDTPGCVWFGVTQGQSGTDEDGTPIPEEGRHFFTLDFSDTRAIREDLNTL